MSATGQAARSEQETSGTDQDEAVKARRLRICARQKIHSAQHNKSENGAQPISLKNPKTLFLHRRGCGRLRACCGVTALPLEGGIDGG